MTEGMDFTLPRLSPRLKFFRGAAEQAHGGPTVVVHDPVSNRYFKLNWIESEILSRFPACGSANEIIKKLSEEEGLDVEPDDIKALASFLIVNGLTDAPPEQAINKEKDRGLWARILERYLYFSIPLFHPQETLDRIYPVLAPFFSPLATKIIFSALFLLGGITLGREDEFLKTYPGLFSFDGAIYTALVFFVVKAVHEWSHALTATKHKIPVPHMGIVFIVLYPVLYTETSGAWRLRNRKDRADIGLAGIRAEMALAALALLVWNLSPAGSLAQILSFLVVTVALVSSLLVNLNPLMRFDGYYIFSDYTGIENLQFRATDMARWSLRKILFALEDAPPEHAGKNREHLLIAFGFALLIYRFFLFTGIAVLVYHIFLKPLGLVLFSVEMWFFVLRPILSELKIWKEKWPAIEKKGRVRMDAAFLGTLLLLWVLPLYGTISAPALSGYKEEAAIHAPYPAQIERIDLPENGRVKKDDVLMVLVSPELERDMDLARQDLHKLETYKRRSTAAPDSPQRPVTDEEIDAARRKIEILEDRRNNLVITAPFDGEIKDEMQGLEEGRYLKLEDTLFRIVNFQERVYTAYVTEEDALRIAKGDDAKFIPDAAPLSSGMLRVLSVEEMNSSTLPSPELFSVYGGEIAVHKDEKGEFRPARGLYKVTFAAKTPERDKRLPASKLRGIAEIEGQKHSPFLTAMKSLAGFVLREIELN